MGRRYRQQNQTRFQVWSWPWPNHVSNWFKLRERFCVGRNLYWTPWIWNNSSSPAFRSAGIWLTWFESWITPQSYKFYHFFAVSLKSEANSPFDFNNWFSHFIMISITNKTSYKYEHNISDVVPAVWPLLWPAGNQVLAIQTRWELSRSHKRFFWIYFNSNLTLL